ncbi:unnamed protein product [Arctia plantaginis]|uniref:Uncharacterized protein n=1 Tax=Arctia plantaginis TaxID=874455 RepID=A0A8S0ZWF3_ARCPL|nr:unnamed protein product [Arctia plantaginis]
MKSYINDRLSQKGAKQRARGLDRIRELLSNETEDKDLLRLDAAHNRSTLKGIALSDLEPKKVLHKPHDDEGALAEIQRLRNLHTRD